MTTLGPYGFTVDRSQVSAAREIEALGFGTLWLRGGQLDRLSRLEELLHASQTAVVGSAIIPPDVFSVADVAALYAKAEATAPGRLLVGLGSPHGHRPLTALNDYVDRLDAAAQPIPAARRLLAALGPHALDVAHDRFAGALPMLFTPEHTAKARARLGPEPLLAIGCLAVLDTDPSVARAIARETLGFTTTLPAYVKSLLRQGFSSDEIQTLDDTLVDRLVAWGGPRRIVERAREHLHAGADHVQFTVLGGSTQPTGLHAARNLALALG